MKILHINKFLWLSGGAERYMFDAAAEFDKHGHEILYFSMADDRNVPCAQSEFFVSHIDYRNRSAATALRNAGKTVAKTVWSRESRHKIRKLLERTRPDIAHLHMIDHHISPSILPELTRAGVPVVQSIHDYKLICPNYQLYIPRTGELCERCLDGHYFHAVTQRCMKGSLAASALVAGAMRLHKSLGVYEKHVDRFLCSTQFLRGKLAQGGAPEDKLRHLPLTVNIDAFPPVDEMEDYAVYVGRVVPEKGLDTLIRAAGLLNRGRVVIVGEGAGRAALEKLASAQAPDRVQFAGFQTGDQLTKLIGRARCVVLPSELYETCGLSLWEGFAMARPAIGARIGGIPESIRENETGWLFPPGDAQALSACIAEAMDDEARARRMGQAGREWVERQCSGHFDRLISVYAEAIASSPH